MPPFFVLHVFVLVPLSTCAASIVLAFSVLFVSHPAPLWHLPLPRLCAMGPGGGRCLCPALIRLHQAVRWLRARFPHHAAALLPPFVCSLSAGSCPAGAVFQGTHRGAELS